MITLNHDAFTKVDATQQHATGQKAYDSVGNKYVYAAGVANCALGSWVAFDSDGTDLSVELLTETLAVAGVTIGVSMGAIIANTWGWFMTSGTVEGLSLISNAAYAVQYATTTAGSLDDDGTTTILGIRLVDTAAAAGLVTYVINEPCSSI
jgi:hypothetical protein